MNLSVDRRREGYEFRVWYTIFVFFFFSWKKTRLIAWSPENMRARECVSPAHTSWKLRRECEDLRALTDAEHALTNVAAFCHFYGPRVPKIWPLSTAKRNTLVSKTRKHDTTEKARSEGPRSHIILYGSLIIRRHALPFTSAFLKGSSTRRKEQRAVCLFAFGLVGFRASLERDVIWTVPVTR